MGGTIVLLIDHSYPEFIRSRLKLMEYLSAHVMVSCVGAVPLPKEIEDTAIIRGYRYQGSRRLSFCVFVVVLWDMAIMLYRLKPNIVHGFKFVPNAAIGLLALAFRFRYIVHVTGLGAPFGEASRWRNAVRVCAKLIFAWKALFADTFIFQNPDDLRALHFLKTGGLQFRLVRGSGVDVKMFKPPSLEEKGRLRDKFGIKRGQFVGLFVGRFIKEKGILDAAAAAGFMDPGRFTLIMAGTHDQECGSRLVALGGGCVRVLAYTENVDVLYKISDVFIFPSYYREGVPRVTLEAMACGLPVITTDSPGCRETVQDGKNGYLVRPERPRDIAIACGNLMRDSELTRRFGCCSRWLAESQFANTLIFSEIADAYRTVSSDGCVV